MDNLTHSLAGIALSRAGLNRLTSGATPVLLFAANIPDIDILSFLGGSAAYLKWHRAHTHALLFGPLMAILPVLAVGLFWRPQGFRWVGAYVASLIGVLCHSLLDWTNMYGIRLALPFSGDWFRLDITNVYDVWILLFLMLSLAAPAFSRLVSSEIGGKRTTGRGWAIAALIFLVGYNFVRQIPHQQAVGALASSVYEGFPPLRAAALPNAWNPLEWRGLVETEDFYAVAPVRLNERFRPEDATLLNKPERTPPIEAAARSGVFRVFLDFAAYPLFRVEPLDSPEAGYLVTANDLRFGQPPHRRFTAAALLDRQYRVVDSGFFFSGEPDFPGLHAHTGTASMMGNPRSPVREVLLETFRSTLFACYGASLDGGFVPRRQTAGGGLGPAFQRERPD